MAATTEPERPTVKLAQGTVVGLTLSDDLPRPVQAFRGIPYALPPTGDRRFRPAVKVEPSTDIIDAIAYGPSGPGKQLLPGGPPIVYSEDCLTANVFKQSPNGFEAGKPLPVAVYIHGGAFNRGTASMHNTASMVAWSEEPFIAVSFNYRIGALGFLPSSASAKEGILNLGLRDQILLFEWVQENIHLFGGDPENVTLIGLSAGAHSIGHHMMHFEESRRPLFNKVVIESGAPTSRAVRPYDAPIHEQQFRDFLQETGCPDNVSHEEIFSYLRAQPTDKITAAQTTVFDKYNPSLRWAFQPVIDGQIIARPPLETWRQGKWHKVPIMTGFTRNEGSLYVNKQLSESSGFLKFFSELLPLLSTEDIETIDKLYPDPATHADSPYKETRDGVGAQYKRIERAYGHYAYVAPVRQTAEFAVASTSLPVYVYHWAQRSSVLDGARHGDNMRYEVCDPKVTSISPTQKTLCRTLNAYITSFITKGDPNAVQGEMADRPKWEVYTKEGPKAMVFGEKNEELVGGVAGVPSELVADDWGRKESEFWWSKVDISQQ
ncbi:hypothetical protein QQZ08_009632 [Neonectria magnoliae]|uniref:Carboxylic ester hydrolase n=1 Tax=Neonectria magnoliae TaxID=2732573 RepID=A0ABR1HMV6_9HYPO